MGRACGDFYAVNVLMDFRSNRASGDGRHDRNYRSKHLAAGFTQYHQLFTTHGLSLVDFKSGLDGHRATRYFIDGFTV